MLASMALACAKCVAKEGPVAQGLLLIALWIKSRRLFLHRCRAAGRLDQVDAGFAIGFVVIALARVGDFLVVGGMQRPPPLILFVFVELEVHESRPWKGAGDALALDFAKSGSLLIPLV